MKVAVCLECGQLKRRAWSACRKCGYAPNDDESMTKHLLVTDQFLGPEEIAAVAAKVQGGETINFNSDVLRQAWVDADKVRRTNRNVVFGGAVLALATIGAGVAVCFWLLS